MRFKLENLLLIFLISLSFYRVDLFYGNFSFLVSPQLFLSILLILVFFIKLIKNHIKIGSIELLYILFLLLLLGYFFLTILFSFHGSLQFKRFFLFSEIIISSICFLLLFNQYSIFKKKEIIKKWVEYSINVHIIWITVQLFLFVNGYHFYADSWSSWKFINPLPHGVGNFLPRLEGGFLDPNVCGYYFSFLFFITKIFKIEINKKSTLLLIIFILLTLSRSSIAAFLICYLILNLKSFKLNIHKALKATFLIFTILLISTFIIGYLNYWDNIIRGLVIRFVDTGSSNIHNSLIELGIQKTFESFQTLIFGNGFSSSPYFAYNLLESTGNKWKYANFHSEYISIFFETGIIGIILYYGTIFIPFLVNKKIEISLIFVLVLLQGIFYQQYNFHYYWIMFSIILCLRNKTVTNEKAL